MFFVLLVVLLGLVVLSAQILLAIVLVDVL